MNESEEHRAEAHCLHARFVAYLRDQQDRIAARVTESAVERGYARHWPEFDETVLLLVRGSVDALAASVEEPKLSRPPGEPFGAGDRASMLVEREVQVPHFPGVRPEVVFGLIQECRAAFLKASSEFESESQVRCRVFVESCFDRMRPGLVNAASEASMAESSAGTAPE